MKVGRRKQRKKERKKSRQTERKKDRKKERKTLECLMQKKHRLVPFPVIIENCRLRFNEAVPAINLFRPREF